MPNIITTVKICSWGSQGWQP